MSAFLDNLVGDTYTQAPTVGQSVSDQYDAAKMEPFNPGAQAGQSWWESSLMYGISRAIDNRFGPVSVAGNVQAGSYAGANGKTYSQNGSAQVAPSIASSLGVSPLVLLLGVGAVVWFALHKS